MKPRKPLIRRTPLPKGTPPKRGRSPKKRKPPRSQKSREWTRIYGSLERVRWVAARSCVVGPVGCVGPVQNVHTASGGTGRKADARTIVPMCAGHHRELHQHGTPTFHASHPGNTLSLLAEATQTAWEAYCDGP